MLMERGGVVMWPLLLLSILSVTLVVERIWFFLRQNHPGQLGRVRQMARLLRRGDREGAASLAEVDATVYGRFVRHLIEEGGSEAAAGEAAEVQRRRLERFMPTLSTVITAAPMLGILGTVLGIITSFDILSDAAQTTDPRAVSGGIAEALITTAVGLVIALIVLFPYNAFRAQIERTLSRLEALASAVELAATQGGSARRASGEATEPAEPNANTP